MRRDRPLGSLNLEVRRLGEGTPTRIHLDIESDNPSAEIDRLIGLGATAVERKTGLRDQAGPWPACLPCGAGATVSTSGARRRPGMSLRR
jgi:Glyoxalase-like domain